MALHNLLPYRYYHLWYYCLASRQLPYMVCPDLHSTYDIVYMQELEYAVM